MNLIFLILSIVLSSTRNTLSKRISGEKFGSRQFFLTQACIFVCGGFTVTVAAFSAFEPPMLLTLLFAMIYGALLLSAQFCYTVALRSGNVGVCSTVYSLGFIFPTLSGCLVWGEKLTVWNVSGILTAISAVVIFGTSISKNGTQAKNKFYIISLLAAMISSGGLGVMQKLQQNSSCSSQKAIFIAVAFFFAGIISFSLALIAEQKPKKTNGIYGFGSAVGVAFALSNLLNTTLAGRLDSAVFFPTLNIGTIIFSLAAGKLFYKDNISKNDLLVLLMGIMSIVLITVF